MMLRQQNYTVTATVNAGIYVVRFNDPTNPPVAILLLVEDNVSGVFSTAFNNRLNCSYMNNQLTFTSKGNYNLNMLLQSIFAK